MSVESTVSADGTIDTYRLEINTSTMVYGLLSESAKEDGYDSLEEAMLSEFDESDYERVSYDEHLDGDRASFSITMEGFDPDESDSIDITEQDGKLVYEDTTFVNESAEMTDSESSYTDGLTLEYTLTMPGEITDSNADETDGNTATWTATGSDSMSDTRIYAESETSSGLASVPGFGAGTAAVALVFAVALFAYRR